MPVINLILLNWIKHFCYFYQMCIFANIYFNFSTISVSDWINEWIILLLPFFIVIFFRVRKQWKDELGRIYELRIYYPSYFIISGISRKYYFFVDCFKNHIFFISSSNNKIWDCNICSLEITIYTFNSLLSMSFYSIILLSIIRWANATNLFVKIWLKLIIER